MRNIFQHVLSRQMQQLGQRPCYTCHGNNNKYAASNLIYTSYTYVVYYSTRIECNKISVP